MPQYVTITYTDKFYSEISKRQINSRARVSGFSVTKIEISMLEVALEKNQTWKKRSSWKFGVNFLGWPPVKSAPPISVIEEQLHLKTCLSDSVWEKNFRIKKNLLPPLVPPYLTGAFWPLKLEMKKNVFPILLWVSYHMKL